MPLCPVEWHAILLVKPGGGRSSRWPRLLPRPLNAHGEDSWPGGWTPLQGFSQGTWAHRPQCSQLCMGKATACGVHRPQKVLARQALPPEAACPDNGGPCSSKALPLLKAPVVSEVRPAALFSLGIYDLPWFEQELPSLQSSLEHVKN